MLTAVNSKHTAERFDTRAVRRFSTADLSEHGAWILKRLLTVYPHLNERTIAGYLRTLVDSNECLFLYQANSIALVQVDRAYGIEARPVVRERYIIAKDPDNKAHIEEAAGFYDHIHAWAKHLNAEFIILGDVNDIPLDTIRKRLGRTFEKQIVYARV